MGHINGQFARVSDCKQEIRAAGLYIESDGEGSRWRAIICTNPLGRQLHEGIGPTRATATLNAYSAWKRGVFEVVS